VFQEYPIYWPTDEGAPLEVGPLSITLHKSDVNQFPGITAREFKIINMKRVSLY